MSVHVAVVSSSREGYRIGTGLEGDPVRTYSNGIELAEAFARQLLETAALKATLDDVSECLKAYNPTGNINWEATFNGLKRDIEEALSDNKPIF